MDLGLFLTNEAISNYVIFILGVVLSSIGWLLNIYLNKKKPKIVKIVRQDEISVFSFNEDLMNDLEVTFKTIPVKNLFISNLYLYNTSEETIDQLLFLIDFSDGDVVFLDFSDKKERGSKVEAVYREDNPSNRPIYQLTIPYLNSSSMYKDVLPIKVFSKNKIDSIEVTSKGRDWGIRYVDIHKQNEQMRNKGFTLDPSENIYRIILTLLRRF